jgi:hypothetical protein
MTLKDEIDQIAENTGIDIYTNELSIPIVVLTVKSDEMSVFNELLGILLGEYGDSSIAFDSDEKEIVVFSHE